MENGKPNTLVQFIVYIVEPLKVLFFNVLIYFLGFKYGGKEGSPIYSIIIILSFATSILLFLKTNSIKKLSSKNLFFFFLRDILPTVYGNGSSKNFITGFMKSGTRAQNVITLPFVG